MDRGEPPTATYRLTLLLLLTLASAPAAAATRTVELGQLSGLKSLFKRLVTPATNHSACDRLEKHTQRGAEQTRRTARWQQFRRVAAAVLGDKSGMEKLKPRRACHAFHHHTSLPLPASRHTTRRDRLAERLYMLGYTPHEIADVLAGLIPMHALQKARRMQALGYTHTDIERYLTRHYTAPRSTLNEKPLPASVPTPPEHNTAANHSISERQRIEQFILRYARRYRVDASLIRAVISHESSWRTNARSHAGAIGLMQLMPGTAKMLGVDPTVPEQNIEGGVRYLAGLLEMFDGDTEAALVAYNAGPTHARKWRRGETVLYGETRTYLQRVKASHARQSS